MEYTPAAMVTAITTSTEDDRRHEESGSGLPSIERCSTTQGSSTPPPVAIERFAVGPDLREVLRAGKARSRARFYTALAAITPA